MASGLLNETAEVGVQQQQQQLHQLHVKAAVLLCSQQTSNKAVLVVMVVLAVKAVLGDRLEPRVVAVMAVLGDRLEPRPGVILHLRQGRQHELRTDVMVAVVVVVVAASWNMHGLLLRRPGGSLALGETGWWVHQRLDLLLLHRAPLHPPLLQPLPPPLSPTLVGAAAATEIQPAVRRIVTAAAAVAAATSMSGTQQQPVGSLPRSCNG
jgi:hypothetical protein